MPQTVLPDTKSNSNDRTHNFLSRSEHGISRQNISSAALRTLYGLRDAGFDAYLVGGGVRDLLIGLLPKDFDIATNARPEQVQRIFRNCRLVGRRFVIVHVRFGDEIIEVTTFRGGDENAGERSTEEGRILRDNVFGTIEEDALRRDFTVNALYYNIADFSVRDFAHGLPDLQARELRLIGNPETRYREDPVRILRAARLCAKLNFAIEAETFAPIADMKILLRDIPPARLFDEVLKMFLAGFSVPTWDVLLDLELMEVLIPGLNARSVEPYSAFFSAAFSSTDQRIAAGKSTSPGFLFSVLGWPLLQQQLLKQANRPRATADVESTLHAEAIDATLLAMTRFVALPRRFSIQVREIWEMLPRLQTRNVARARRMLSNPRLRAAYDFLLMLGAQDPELAKLAERWGRAQVEGANLDQIFENKRSNNSDRAVSEKSELAKKAKTDSASFGADSAAGQDDKMHSDDALDGDDEDIACSRLDGEDQENPGLSVAPKRSRPRRRAAKKPADTPV